MQLKPLYVVGAGGFAREVVENVVYSINRASPTWDFRGYIEKDHWDVGKKVGRHTVALGQEEFKRLAARGGPLYAVVAIGNTKAITAVVSDLLQEPNIRFPNLIHPNASYGYNVRFGEGNIVCEGNILTTDITIGSYNILNLGNTFGHDTVVGDCCVFNPGCHISGATNIASRSFFGTGAIILEGLSTGEGTTVGGGAVVTKNIEGGVFVGVPARPLVKA